MNITRVVFVLVGAIFLITPVPVRAQSEPSLGDVARKAREQRAQSKPEATPASEEAQRLAAELEQEQEEAGSAPEGFQNYNAEGYRVAIPAPFSVEGRDDNGVLLATADITGVTTKVFAATPVPVGGLLGELEFQDWARAFWQPYGSITCAKPKPGVPGHECSVTGNLFGNQFSGNARFLNGDNRIVPVICFATAIPEEDADYSIRRRTQEEIDNLRAIGQRNVARRDMAYHSDQLCSAVLDSIRLKEEYGRSGAKLVPARAQKAPPAVASETSTGGSSLADVARQSRKTAAQQGKPKVSVEAEDTINRPPPGYRVHSSSDCGRECWQESLFLPENARHVRGGNSDNVYVAALDDNTSVVIYFGRTDVVNGYSEYGNAQTVARKWVHAQPDYKAKVINIPRTMNGQDAVLERTRLLANIDAWTELDVKIPSDDVNFALGCIAREDRFADAEAICSTVFDSWRIHR